MCNRPYLYLLKALLVPSLPAPRQGQGTRLDCAVFAVHVCKGLRFWLIPRPHLAHTQASFLISGLGKSLDCIAPKSCH